MSSLRMALKLSMEAETTVPPVETAEAEARALVLAKKRKDEAARRAAEKSRDTDEEGKKSRSSSVSSVNDLPPAKRKPQGTIPRTSSIDVKDAAPRKSGSGRPSAAAKAAQEASVPVKKSGGGQNQWTKKRELERVLALAAGGDAAAQASAGRARSLSAVSDKGDKEDRKGKDRDVKKEPLSGLDSTGAEAKDKDGYVAEGNKPPPPPPRSHKKREGETAASKPGSSASIDADGQRASGKEQGGRREGSGSAGDDSSGNSSEQEGGNAGGGGHGSRNSSVGHDSANEEEGGESKAKEERDRKKAAAPKRSHAKKKVPRETREGGIEDDKTAEDQMHTTPHKRPRSFSSDDFVDDMDTTPRYQSSRAAAQVAKEKISNKGNPKYGVIEEATNESEFAVYRSQTKSTPRPSRARPEPVVEPQWVQCNRCEKWRTVPAALDLDTLPESWFCELNTWNPALNKCEAEEEVVDDEANAAMDEDDWQINDGVVPTSSGRSRSKSSRSRSRASQRDRDSLDSDHQHDRGVGGDFDGGLLSGTVQVLETNWVQCAKCEKWRTVPLNEEDAAELPDSWECKDNVWAPLMASCDAAEEVQQELPTVEQTREMHHNDRSHSQRSGAGRRPGGQESNLQLQQQGQGQLPPVAPAVAAPSQWVQCDRKGCRKWRVVPADFDMESLPEKWFCEMNTWNIDRASCDVPDDSEEEAASRPNVRTALILGNNKGPGTLSYRRIIFGTDGKVRPAYSEHNQNGYGLFSHVEPVHGNDEEKVHIPLRTTSYWWSEMANDMNGPNTALHRLGESDAAYQKSSASDLPSFQGMTGAGGNVGTAGAANPAAASSGTGKGTKDGKDKEPKSPRSPKAGRSEPANDIPCASVSAAAPVNAVDDPQDTLNGIGVRVLQDNNKNNGNTNHHSSYKNPSYPLLLAARKIAGFPQAVPTQFIGCAKFHKLTDMNRRMTWLEREWCECVVIRSCLLGACSASGLIVPVEASESSPSEKGNAGNDSDNEEQPADDSEDSDGEGKEDPPLLSMDSEGHGGAPGSISLKSLLQFIQTAHFHRPEVDVVRASMTMDSLRAGVRRLEQQGEVFVSMSTCGEPCVHSIPVHMGNGTFNVAPELAQFPGIPLKMRKTAARNRALRLGIEINENENGDHEAGKMDIE